jgi:hypothetical protein
MLTHKQIRTIKQYGIATLHDYWSMSLVFGEPFFEQGVLAYYDGRIVTFCGFPLRGESPIENKLILSLSQQWITERAVEAVVYFGSNHLDFRRLKHYGFRRTDYENATEQSSELFLDCSIAPEAIYNLWFYKRAAKIGFKSRVRAGGIIPANYLKLIETFYQNTEVTGYLANIAFAIHAILRSQTVHLIEAWRENRLCGFATLHKAFSDVAVGLFLAHDYKTPRVSDFLYGETLIYARRLGVAHINIGPSPSLGHYSFKRKWGGQPIIPPTFYTQWTRGNLARRYHTAWGPRIVKL